jgi:MoxR-like ATPase
MASITILNGPESGKTYPLIPGRRLIIGREADCDLRINQPSISRHHAVIVQSGNAWSLDDLQSQNGVFVDEEQVLGTRTLFSACTLRFGEVLAAFDPADSGAPAVTSAAVAEALPEQPAGSTSTLSASAAVRPLDEAEAVEQIRQMGDISGRIVQEFGKVIVGQRQVAEELLIAIAAGGHCLMIGLPGLAKTLMVSTLARVMELSFKRVQFTPDLMPSDIIGTDILEVDADSGRKSFRFIKGPVFTNMLLADEINRTPPKTQAALLEAMQEKQVTASNQHFALPPPFFVLATQNPLEQEGTYPLPEAQLDRFMFNILVDYPSEEEEEAIIMSTTGKTNPQLRKIIGAQELLSLQALVRALPISPHVVKYATRLVRSTRPKSSGAPDYIQAHVHCGAGPRAAQCLVLGAKARAVLQGRVNVSCADVKAIALPVLRHRIFTNFSADSEGISVDDLIRKLLITTPEPNEKDY